MSLLLLGFPSVEVQCADRVGSDDSAAASGKIEQLLELSGVFRDARTATDTMIAQLRADNPAVPAEVWSTVAPQLTDRGTLLAVYAPILERHVAQSDVVQLLVFYRSPLGTHLVAVMPQIQQECRAAAVSWANSVAADLVASLGIPGDTGGSSESPGSLAPVTSARDRAIRTLLQTSGAVEDWRNTINQFIDRLRNAPGTSDLPPMYWERARARLTNESDLLRLWGPAYGHYLSDLQIRQLIAFYRSGPAQRYVSALPAIRQESIDSASRLAAETMRRAIRQTLGPLPQWKLQHPDPIPASGEPAKDPSR